LPLRANLSRARSAEKSNLSAPFEPFSTTRSLPASPRRLVASVFVKTPELLLIGHRVAAAQRVDDDAAESRALEGELGGTVAADAHLESGIVARLQPERDLVVFPRSENVELTAADGCRNPRLLLRRCDFNGASASRAAPWAGGDASITAVIRATSVAMRTITPRRPSRLLVLLMMNSCLACMS
jgi:hypothetical protein